MPSPIAGLAVVALGAGCVIVRPEVAVVFVAFGWVTQRQALTYYSGVPLLLLGFFGAALCILQRGTVLRRDTAFLSFISVSTLFAVMTVLISPQWRDAATARLLSVGVAMAVYSLCESREGQRTFEVASIVCGTSLAINAIVGARLFGEALLHTGDVADLPLNDSNYGSLPILFGISLALARLSHIRWRWTELLLTAALGVMTWGILVLASRGAEVAVVAVVVVWVSRLMLKNRRPLSFVSRVAAVAAVSVAMWLVSMSIPNDVLIGNRIRWDKALSSGGSNRSELYRTAFETILTHPLRVLAGGGIGNNLDSLQGVSVHNQALDTLFDYGMLGLLSLGWLWSRFLLSGFSNTQPTGWARDSILLPAVGLGVAAVWLSPIWFTFFWIEIAYLAASVTSLQRPAATELRYQRATTI